MSKKEDVTSEVRQRLKQGPTVEHAAIGKSSKRRISEESEEDEIAAKQPANKIREEETEKSGETTDKIAAEITRMEAEEGHWENRVNKSRAKVTQQERKGAENPQ